MSLKQNSLIFLVLCLFSIPGLDRSGLWVWVYNAISVLIMVTGVFYVPWFTLVPKDCQKTDMRKQVVSPRVVSPQLKVVSPQPKVVSPQLKVVSP